MSFGLSTSLHEELGLTFATPQAGTKADAMERAMEILAIIEDSQFWAKLKSILLLLEPLAKAANITQGDGARLDIVLVTLANLYHYFTSTPGLNERAVTAVLTSLERRWAAADQDTFLLALILNPYIRLDCFAANSPFRIAGHIRQMAETAFERFYGVPPGLDFAHELVEYLHGKGHWSADSMNLKNEKARAKAEGKEVNLIDIWRTWTPVVVDSEAPTALPSTGAARLALLAMRILSIVPNSAATERIFSLFGFVHTKHRNRLGKDKARKQVLIRVDTARKFGSGVSSSRKRKFGTDSEDEDDTAHPDDVYPVRVAPPPSAEQAGNAPPPSAEQPGDVQPATSDEQAQPEHPDIDYMAVFRELEEDAVEAADVTDRSVPVPIFQAIPRDSDARKLKNLFLYPRPGQNAHATRILTHYWARGQRSLSEEEQFQDAVYAEAHAQRGINRTTTAA